MIPEKRERHDYWNHNAVFHRELVRDAAARGGRALDVGCGDGLLVQRLAGVCREVTGVDNESAALLRARRRLAGTPSAHVLDADIMSGATAELLGRFETVTCVAVLHHLPLEAGLVRLSELVAPGGRLIIVGLAANESAWDWLLSGLTLIPARAAGRWHHQTRDIGVLTAPARESLREIRAVAARVLPGCRLRRRMYWRYRLTWDRPGTA